MCCLPEATDIFQTFDDVMAYLDGLGMFHQDLALDRISKTLDKLNASRLPCPVVQIIGTNGKGSTATFLHSIAMAHGFRSGLYTSPHFVSPAERIRMNNRQLPPMAWPRLVSQVHQANSELTYFEILTALAAISFRDTEPDVLFFEAGLGGRHDATTAVQADLVCFTPIALDHQNVLGATLSAIAEDKAAAIRQGVFAAVSAYQTPKALDCLLAKSRQAGIPLYGANKAKGILQLSQAAQTLQDRVLSGVNLGLAGPHQLENARTALTVWLLLCEKNAWHCSENSMRQGLERAFIPGRLQMIAPNDSLPGIILDGAHNPHSMAALKNALGSLHIKPGAVIFSCLADKNPPSLMPSLRDISGTAPIFTPTIRNNQRASNGNDLAKIIGPNALAVPDLPIALAETTKLPLNGAPVLICGSLYLLAEFFSLYPQALDWH